MNYIHDASKGSMMKNKIKADWVNALRSGKYRQGYDELYDGQAFTALGVLTQLFIDMYQKQGWCWLEDGGLTHASHSLSKVKASEVLSFFPSYSCSEDVKAWSGITDIQEGVISRFDDSVEPLTFVEIAKFIEEEF